MSLELGLIAGVIGLITALLGLARELYQRRQRVAQEDPTIAEVVRHLKAHFASHPAHSHDRCPEELIRRVSSEVEEHLSSLPADLHPLSRAEMTHLVAQLKAEDE